MRTEKIAEIQKKIFALSSKYKYFLLVVGIGILFMLTSIPAPASTETKAEETPKVSDTFSLPDFEEKLRDRLSLIDGAGRVELVLSLKSGEEAVYAENVNRSSQTGMEDTVSASYQSTLSVISNSGYGETPVLLKNKYPEFRGALILCDGADSDKVRLEINEAVKALCGITSDHISILKMKEQGGNSNGIHS